MSLVVNQAINNVAVLLIAVADRGQTERVSLLKIAGTLKDEV